jgi:hypothetical protein
MLDTVLIMNQATSYFVVFLLYHVAMAVYSFVNFFKFVHTSSTPITSSSEVQDCLQKSSLKTKGSAVNNSGF